MMKRNVYLFWISLIMAGVWLGAGSLPAAAQTKANTVKIGALLTLTGSMSVTGQDMKDATEYAAEMINAQGGIKSLGGAKVQIVYGDSQAKPNMAVSETERLIEKENVVAIVDQYPSATTIAATSVAERKKTPYVVGISYADIITERGYYYTFQLEPPAAYVGVAKAKFIDWLGKKMGKKLTRVAHLYEDTDWGQSVAKSQRQYWKSNGYDPVVDMSYARPLSDASSLLAKVKAGNPDIVVFQAYIADDILFVKTAHRFDLWNVPWLATGTAMQPAMLDAVKEQGDGLFDLNMWAFDISKEARAFNDKYLAKYKKDMDGNAALLYQSVFVVKEGLETAGKADRQALADALHKIKIGPGHPSLFLPYEYISFDQKGVNGGGGFIFSQVQNQRWVTLYPEKYAGSQVRILPAWKK
jgi:branched-chain amino acid transport system substrate-binding protein